MCLVQGQDKHDEMERQHSLREHPGAHTGANLSKPSYEGMVLPAAAWRIIGTLCATVLRLHALCSCFSRYVEGLSARLMSHSSCLRSHFTC